VLRFGLANKEKILSSSLATVLGNFFGPEVLNAIMFIVYFPKKYSDEIFGRKFSLTCLYIFILVLVSDKKSFGCFLFGVF